MLCSIQIQVYYRVRPNNFNFKSIQIQIYIFYSVWWYSFQKIKQEKERGNWNKQQKVLYIHVHTIAVKLSFKSISLASFSVDGQWTSYNISSDWGACSVSCGEGTTTRVLSRSCTNPSPQYGGKDCIGGYTKTETKPCNDRECPGYSWVFLIK